MAEAFTVTQVNNYIKNIFARDFVLNRISVSGEVSNCKYHSSGHIYFTLKDRDSQLSCIMFASSRQGLKFRLSDGQQVEATGQISVYEKSGSYQLYVRSCALAGAGELYERFLKLKAELEEMGMFDQVYKKQIPLYCRRIGIVTSPTGAAIRDIVQVSKRRDPYAELVLCPALVQGEDAAASVARGIERLDALGLDVIIVGRGGGSIEDLWAFNTETVAQAIFNAQTPIISAVGHETDFTIADFVADLRAPTPSAAAELANFDFDALEEELESKRQMLMHSMRFAVNSARSELLSMKERLNRLSPMARLSGNRHSLEAAALRMKHAAALKSEPVRHRLDNCRTGLDVRMTDRLKAAQRRLTIAAARLDAVSPLKRISGGYGYLESDSGKALTTIADVKAGDKLTAYVSDGRISAEVTGVESMQYGVAGRRNG